MPEQTNNLLDAEQAVQELLSELEALKNQIEGYRGAREALDRVSQKLSELVGQTQNLTQETHQAIKVLTKIGTPEILSAIREINEAIKIIDVNLKDHIYKVNSKISEVTTIFKVILVPIFLICTYFIYRFLR